MLLVYKLMASGSAFFIVCYGIYWYSQNKTLSFFDSAKAVKVFHGLIYLILVLLLVLDFFVEKHDHIKIANTPEFYAAFSVISCVVLMVIARIFRFLLKRDEDYYE